MCSAFRRRRRPACCRCGPRGTGPARREKDGGSQREESELQQVHGCCWAILRQVVSRARRLGVTRKLPYSPGDIFAVPLRDHGYALDVVARADGNGIVLGYFFGPRVESLEVLPQACALEANSAIKVCRFGDLGLIRGKWPVVGRVESWDPTQWRVPEFCRDGNIRVVYDGDSLAVSHEEPLDSRECRLLPQDGLEGAGFVEIKLTRLLGA
ncbi:hypothetical protein StrepF001_33330 [Streptomyces sp. F001]|nr:hypothetical protein StrepF001_33330 [Streptomyces sp. F001]